jgi:tripartite-type tricarboxylate transporter receptor subunit TctC
MRRRELLRAFLPPLGFWITSTIPVRADAYPSRSVRLIVPFAAGGPLDLVARMLADQLSTRIKQPFVIENRAGGGGNIGTDVAAKAAADGYTLLIVLSSVLTANPSLYRKLSFDAQRDFRPISIVATSTQMLVVHPSLPVNSVSEFVSLAKKEPLTYAHAGPGSGGHLAMEYFRTVAGFETNQIPYRGNAPLVIDLVAGQVKAGFVSTAGVIGHVLEKRLKPLAISSQNRSPLAPDVPTIVEAGYPQFNVETTFSLLAPVGVLDRVVHLLEREVQEALRVPELVEKLRLQDIVPVGTTATEARRRLEAETELWAAIIRAAKMQID